MDQKPTPRTIRTAKKPIRFVRRYGIALTPSGATSGRFHLGDYRLTRDVGRRVHTPADVPRCFSRATVPTEVMPRHCPDPSRLRVMGPLRMGAERLEGVTRRTRIDVVVRRRVSLTKRSPEEFVY